MRSAPGLLRRAVAAGVVDADAVLAGRVALVPASWSNLIHRVEVDGQPAGFVKQAGQAAVLDQLGVDAEAVALRTLAAVLPPGSVPALLPGTGDGTVWTSRLPGRALGEALGLAPVPIASALGRLLARLHTLPPSVVRDVPAAPLPWPLLDDLPPSLVCPPGSAPAEVLAQRQQEPQATTLEQARRAWASARHTWVHGDVSATNVLVADHHGEITCAVIDLEAAGVGDPSWDVVSARATLAGTLRALDPRTADGALVAFEASYREHGGPGRSTPGLELAHQLCQDYRHAAMAYRRELGAHRLPGAPV